MYHWY